MARVGRLAGAILAETDGGHFLVGNTVEPCDFAAAGFETPVEIDALRRPYLVLGRLAGSAPVVPAPHLVVGVEGEQLACILAERFLIERNGSVSDRLWRLVAGYDDQGRPPADAVDARWLGEVPPAIWAIVRDAVLRCT